MPLYNNQHHQNRNCHLKYIRPHAPPLAPQIHHHSHFQPITTTSTPNPLPPRPPIYHLHIGRTNHHHHLKIHHHLDSQTIVTIITTIIKSLSSPPPSTHLKFTTLSTIKPLLPPLPSSAHHYHLQHTSSSPTDYNKSSKQKHKSSTNQKQILT